MVYNLSIKAVSSAVEHLPYKQMATGSNPVPPIVKSKRPLLNASPFRGFRNKNCLLENLDK
jgi:hypothetical protein